MAAEPKKTCCRSTPRCGNCPVLLAHARRSARARVAGPASLFDEIYGAPRAALPESVAQALAALELARDPGRRTRRERTDRVSFMGSTAQAGGGGRHE